MNITASIYDGNTLIRAFTADEISAVKRSASFGGSGYPIGVAAIGSLSLTVPSIEDTIPDRAKVIFSAAGTNKTFYLDKISRNYGRGSSDRMTLSCMDFMAFTNQSFDYEPTAADKAEAEYKKNYVKFSKAIEYIEDTLTCTITLQNCNYQNGYLSTKRDYTMREVLGFIAAANGGNAYCSGGNAITIAGRYGNFRELTITRDNYSPVKFGKAWRCAGLVLSNGTKSASVGALTDKTTTIELEIPIPNSDIATAAASIFSALQYYYYIPFQIEKMFLGENADMSLCDTLDISDYPQSASKPIVMSYTASYSAAGVFVTPSAPDVYDTRSAFAYEKVELKKNQKVGSVEYGNKYGVKTSAEVTPQSVGADGASQLRQMRLYGGELIAEDATDDEEIIDAGKIYLDNFTSSGVSIPAINMKIPAGVLGAEETDLITELKKGSGGSDIPSWYLDCPHAPSGWIYMTVSDAAASIGFSITTYDSTLTWSVSIDWGDGNTETFVPGGTYDFNPTHDYSASAGGHSCPDGTKQYLVKIQASGEGCYLSHFGPGWNAQNILKMSINVSADFLPSSENSGGTNPIFGYSNSVAFVEILSTVDATFTAKIGYQCYSISQVILPEGMTAICNSFLYDAHNLRQINIPSTVTGIEGNAFANCYGLREINIPEGCIVNSTAFANCINLPQYST